MVDSETVVVGQMSPILTQALWTAVLVWLLYLVTRSMNRLYFSPLSHIPGPGLAALTRWYEAYYEIVLNGRYSFHIDELHDKYGNTYILLPAVCLVGNNYLLGPIVRVAPDEIHIRDSEFYDELYAKNLQVEKPGWDVKFGSPLSIFTTTDAVTHRRLRAALNPM